MSQPSAQLILDDVNKQSASAEKTYKRVLRRLRSTLMAMGLSVDFHTLRKPCDALNLSAMLCERFSSVDALSDILAAFAEFAESVDSVVAYTIFLSSDLESVIFDYYGAADAAASLPRDLPCIYAAMLDVGRLSQDVLAKLDTSDAATCA
jgi:hypothetical protein